MAAKNAKKASKTLGKKAMKKTKGGAIFVKLDGLGSSKNLSTNNLNAGNLNQSGNLNFHK